MADEGHGEGVRAFLIADVRGYTSFTQERGDVEAARLASRFAALVRDCVDAAGGRVVELRGDEALCVFDSPRQALRTAVALQGRFADATREDPSLPMRVGIGLEAGEAVAVEGGFRGAALNLAARLCALAGPWEVLAGDGIVLMAGRVDELAYSDRGRVSVKGVREPVRVNQLQFELDLPPAPESPRPFWTRRRLVAATLAGAAVVGAAVAAFVILRSADNGPEEVAGDSAALLEPATGDLIEQFPVGATPIAVVSDDSAAWTLDADSQTISRIEPGGGRPLTKAAPGTPTGIALGGGLLWVAYVQRDTAGTRAGIAALDPSTLSPRGTPMLLPGVGPSYGALPAVVYADGAPWVSGPLDQLRRIDSVSRRVRATVRLGEPPEALAVGLGSLWATVGRKLVRIDPRKARKTKTIPLLTPGLGALTVSGDSVWAADPLAGVLWRIRPGPPVDYRTVRVALGATGLASGRGSIWVASAIDGQVVRVDGATERVVATYSVGNAPLAVSVAPAGIWTAVAAAGGRSVASRPKLLGLETLPVGTCSSPVYGGSGNPDKLIVSDLPTQAADAPVSLAMVQAIEFVLRRHHFRAGPYRIAYQACDDATVAEGSYSEEKCAANTRTYAATKSVIGVIGPVNSGCATQQVPIVNRANPGPLAIVSPTTSYIGLTRRGPGVGPKDPGAFYPTGIRNFVRVYPPDDAQGAAGAVVAKKKGARRVYVFGSDPNDSYGFGLGVTFAKAARRLGIGVDGPHVPLTTKGALRSLARRLRAAGTDAVYVGALNDERSARFIRAIRDELGRRLLVIAPDAFLLASEQVHLIGKQAIGMYVTGGVITDPKNQLPPDGRNFVREFSATQTARNVNYFAPYAAQAAEVLLQAIANSDGSRASVTRELFRVKIKNGILGSFGFDAGGDITSSRFPVFRVTRTKPEVVYPEDRVVTVIAAPLRLIR